VQHDGFLLWVVPAALTLLGTLLGRYCLHTAWHYRQLLLAGADPDASSLWRAFGAAWRSDSAALIIESVAPQRAVVGLALLVPALALGALGLQLGPGMAGWVLVPALATLVLLACIDWASGLLPDALTLPLMWAGLALAWLGLGPALHDSLAGLALGWGLAMILRGLWWWRCRAEGLGLGDAKLLAALGAWLGAGRVLDVLLFASLGGILFAMGHQRRLRPAGAYPFGPFLALAGGAALVFPPFP